MKIFQLKLKFRQGVSILYTKLTKNEFHSFGDSKIDTSAKIIGAKNIKIGDRITIRENSWLYALSENAENKDPIIEIQDNVYLGHQLHLVAVKKVVIEKNALIADKVYISDNLHNYQNINLPIKDQGVNYKGDVIIGENCWIGENACIIGSSVGKNSVVGANAVVTKDVPPYCIAVGVPAIIIKRYDFQKQEWVNTH